MNIHRVKLTRELAAFVNARIERFVPERAATEQWLAPYVQRFAILPLFCGWSESIGILASGEIRRFATEGEYEGLQRLASLLDFKLSIVEGARRYPALAVVLLKPPAEAASCVRCKGTGHLDQLSNGMWTSCDCVTGWLVPPTPEPIYELRNSAD